MCLHMCCDIRPVRIFLITQLTFILFLINDYEMEFLVSYQATFCFEGFLALFYITYVLSLSCMNYHVCLKITLIFESFLTMLALVYQMFFFMFSDWMRIPFTDVPKTLCTVFTFYVFLFTMNFHMLLQTPLSGKYPWAARNRTRMLTYMTSRTTIFGFCCRSFYWFGH